MQIEGANIIINPTINTNLTRKGKDLISKANPYTPKEQTNTQKLPKKSENTNTPKHASQMSTIESNTRKMANSTKHGKDTTPFHNKTISIITDHSNFMQEDLPIITSITNKIPPLGIP